MSAIAILFGRQLLLAVWAAWTFTLCAGASVRAKEGASGIAVRMLATVILPATALAFVGLFYWPLALFASAVAAWWQGVGSLGYLCDRMHEVWHELSIVTKTAVSICAVVVAIRAVTLAVPPTDGDSLLYHLPMTAALAQDHTMWFTRALVYPAASEIADALSVATAGTVNAIALISLLEVVALAFVAFAWGRRAGASVDGAAAAAAVALCLPMVVDQMMTAQNDILVCTLIAAACVLWRPHPRVAAIALGLLLATKLSAFIAIPVIGIVMIAAEGWPFGICDVAVAVVIALPWYVRTWVLSGSPVYTIASLGWDSTIAANWHASAGFVVHALRIYGGVASVAGAIAVIVLALWRSANRFARTLLGLALAGFIVWVILPNSAESVAGTLDQIRQGWSLRYALFLPFVLATAVPVALGRIRALPLAGFAGLIAAASAVVRAANLTASEEALGLRFTLPVLLVFAISITTVIRARCEPDQIDARARIAGLAAIVAWSVTMTAGSISMQQLWIPTYLQWSNRIPPTTMLVESRLQNNEPLAVMGMRSFPFVGPDLQRRTYEDIIDQPPGAWVESLRWQHVGVLVASGESGSPDEPGFLKALPAELQIASLPGVCRLKTDLYARLYGLTPTECANQ